MGWSISHVWPEPPDAISTALCAAGRALFLASAFESKCVYVLRIGLLAHAVVSDPDKHLGELLGSVPHEQRLHRAIEMLAKLPEIDQDQARLLRRAKEARNFIAHEGAAYGHIFSVRDATVARKMSELREEVAHLVAGDNILSAMVYDIEEKEPAPRQLVEQYPELVDSWVFGSWGSEQP